jgi:hypothetical protein
VIVFLRWVRARRSIRHLGPVDFTLRPVGETMLYLCLFAGFYLLALPGAVIEAGWFGVIIGVVIVAFEVRAVLYQRDERIELRGRDLVVHHLGKIEVFDRADVESIEMEDYVIRPHLGRYAVPRPVSVLRLTATDGVEREVWQCSSRAVRQDALRSALAVFHEWMRRFDPALD